MALIEVEGVYKSYRLGEVMVPALNGVDLKIEAGAFAVLAGRSGSGKTTMLNILGALDLPDRGVVKINGDDYLTLSKDQRAAFRLRHVGFVFQAYNLIRVLTARENVAYVLELQGVAKAERRERAEYWLGQVGLEGLGDRRPDQLSGGQQQRVAVARALAAGPDIVLADEPTANLDSATGKTLIALMERLNREHDTSFVLASHDPMVIGCARPLVRLEDGRVVDIGPVN